MNWLLFLDANAFWQNRGPPSDDDPILRDRIPPSTDPSGLVQEEIAVVAVNRPLQAVV
jgi:hypothetical protein